jgi:SAM-dependent methyltransferase
MSGASDESVDDGAERNRPTIREEALRYDALEIAYRSLMSSDGQMLLAQMAADASSETDELRMLTKYRKRYPAELVNTAFAQLKLRMRARTKFTRADRMYFTPDGLEQASTERMARYHAGQFAAFDQIIDLCCGIGGDLIAFAEQHHTVAIDIDPFTLRLAVANAGAYERAHNVQAVEGDVTLVGFWGAEAPGFFIDPARRVDGRRLPAGKSQPSLEWCFEFGASFPLVVKASPALPLELVPLTWAIEFVSEGRELKESLITSPKMDRPARRATVLLPDVHSLDETPGDAIAVKEPGAFLLDPDPAVTRAGLVEDLARSVQGDIWKIDLEVAFLSSHAPIDTPFGRCLRIEASLPWNLNRLKETLRSLDIGSVDIRKRGSAVDVDDIQRRLKLTGTRPATVVLTRMMGKPWALVCMEPERSANASASTQ